MEQKKTYTVFSQRVALTLKNFGYKWIRIEPNTRFKGFNVWVFEDSEELRAAIDMINGKQVN